MDWEENQKKPTIEEEKATQQKPPEQKKEEPKKPNMFSSMINKLIGYRRVIDVAKKPDKEEYTGFAKITGLGILLLGAIGFVLFLVAVVVVP